ncbi:MAG: chorismate synthase [Muribaculaceae bacterium]|nr:chorismate synthase [Muribaculaceae bacterium]
MNTFGNTLRLTTFGESHGIAMGGVLDGVPPGLTISLGKVAEQTARRRPGYSALASRRTEPDKVEFLSGLMATGTDGGIEPLTPDTDLAVTLGTPIGFIIKNTGQRSADYEYLKETFRPSHADLAWHTRYGIRDWRGGGRSSGRETVSRVVGGAIARQILELSGISIRAVLSSVGGVTDPSLFAGIISKAAEENDSVGGVVECRVNGFMAGTGDPVFGKLQQRLAAAMLSIGGTKGFEYGDGFAIASMRGSEAADCLKAEDGTVRYLSNHSGGIQGGISNGEEIVFRVAFKPTPSIGKPLETINSSRENVVLRTFGRHDPCIALRGVPVVEAMAALVLLDSALADGYRFPTDKI